MKKAEQGVGIPAFNALLKANNPRYKKERWTWDRMTKEPLNETVRFMLRGLNPGGAAFEGVGELLDTWLCTETEKYSHVTQNEKRIIALLRDYASAKHYGWMASYLVNGSELVKAIARQEKEIRKFYDILREILVIPVTRIYYHNHEMAFQIYLLVTQMLFKKYMPEFNFEETK
jgi:hypothetical protein